MQLFPLVKMTYFLLYSPLAFLPLSIAARIIHINTQVVKHLFNYTIIMQRSFTAEAQSEQRIRREKSRNRGWKPRALLFSVNPLLALRLCGEWALTAAA